MRRLWLLALIVMFAVFPTTAAGAPAGNSGNFPAQIDLPNGFFPEGIEGGPGTTYFVGSLADGAIRRGDLRTGSGAELAAGAPGRVSIGMAYEAGQDRLWVAGGGPALFGLGDVRVYDASSGTLLATYLPAGVGFLNDVTVTRDAVYVTDSGSANLVVLPLPSDGSLPSGPTTLTVTGDFVLTSEVPNLNGIVNLSGWLLTVQSSTGKLFRVEPASGIATEVDLGGAVLSNGDGLELVGHTLYVVRNFANRVTVVRLGAGLTTGTVLGDITDPSLDIPTTATVAAGRLWVANARFSTAPGPDTAYWITQLPRWP